MLIEYTLFFLLTSINTQVIADSSNYCDVTKSTNSIECFDTNYCYVSCKNCANLNITTNSMSVEIDVDDCNYLTIFSQYADNFNLIYKSSYSGELHLENVTHINVTYSSIEYSRLFGQYAVNFLFQAGGLRNRENYFYLDYVSNQINFEGNSAYSSKIIISALYANNFTASMVDDLDVYLIAPFHAENVVNIYDTIWRGREANIFLPNVYNSMYTDYSDLVPFNFNLDVNESVYFRFTLWCNNVDGIYQSKTEIIYESYEYIECTNVTSECCYANDFRNDIFCKDGDNELDGICIVDCVSGNGTIGCEKSNINPSNLTTELYVLCGSLNDCYQTVINCPMTMNSICDVSCDIFRDSCYHTTIKYNTNNQDIILNCSDHYFSCDNLQVFIDKFENINQNGVINTMNVDISCHYCYEASFVVNANVNQFDIHCFGNGCRYSTIYASTTKHLNIYCNGSRSCRYMSIYPNYNLKDSLTIYCFDTEACTDMRIFTALQYELDYLSMVSGGFDVCSPSFDNGIACDLDNNRQISRYYKMNTLIGAPTDNSSEQCGCTSDYSYYTYEKYCCPFSNVWQTINYCIDGDDCTYNISENHLGTLIYANNAQSLSLVITDSSFIRIFAINATNVSITCINQCYDIELNGFNIETFNLECNVKDESLYDIDTYNNRACANLLVDVLNANRVTITADYLTLSQIYASNVIEFVLTCYKCDYNHIVLPSSLSASISINCKNDDACSSMLLYSYHKWNNINIHFESCFGELWEKGPWRLYCKSPIDLITDSTNFCENKYRASDTFCECSPEITNSELIKKYAPLATYTVDPFASECINIIFNKPAELLVTFQSTFGILITIISFCIIIWFICIFLKNLFVKCCATPIKYNKLIETPNIEPPSVKVLYYIHYSDVLIWITQIYILIICNRFYFYLKDDICTLINNDLEYKEYVYNILKQQCSLKSYCIHESNGNCTISDSIYAFYILSVIALSIAIVLNFIFAYCYRDINLLTHSILLKFYYKDDIAPSWNDVITNYYYKRKFFGYTLYIGFLMFSRIFIFFIGPIYFLFFVTILNDNDIQFSIKWYDIIPILLLFILNEILKKRYKMLMPYNLDKHIIWILNDIYGNQIASIIWMYLEEDDNEEHESTISIQNDDDKHTSKILQNDNDDGYELTTTEMQELIN